MTEKEAQTQNRLLIGILASLLGIGGLQGIGQIGKSDGADELKTKVEAIDRTVNRTDANGVPLIYVPRDMLEQQKQAVQELREIRDVLERQNPR